MSTYHILPYPFPLPVPTDPARPRPFPVGDVHILPFPAPLTAGRASKPGDWCGTPPRTRDSGLYPQDKNCWDPRTWGRIADASGGAGLVAGDGGCVRH